MRKKRFNETEIAAGYLLNYSSSNPSAIKESAEYSSVYLNYNELSFENFYIITIFTTFIPKDMHLLDDIYLSKQYIRLSPCKIYLNVRYYVQ